MQQIGKELGVRFALQGGVQRSGDKIRISAQLADTTTNAQLWSESFDGSQGDLFALQEMVTARIGNSIGREMVIVAARESEARKGDPKIADLLLRARAAEFQSGYAERPLYRQILDVEANNTNALARLARSLSLEAYDPEQIEDRETREKQFAQARNLALMAKEKGSNDPVVYAVLSDYALEHGDHVGAIRLAEAALTLDPKNPDRYVDAAGAYLWSGQAKKSIELLVRGERLNPKRNPAGMLCWVGVAYFMLGDDHSAIEWLVKSVDANPGLTAAYPYLAMAYASKGDHSASKAAVTELLRRDPGFNLSKMDTRKSTAFPPEYREYWETKLLPAWRLAGLPE